MYSHYTLKDQKRFWSKVSISDELGDCWEWQAGRGHYGHGQFTFHGKGQGAHRVAYMLTYGDLKGLHVLHKCDNPPCCNPTHLWLGTHQDNMKDMFRKNRGVMTSAKPGETHHNCKLTREQVIEIRKRYSAGGITITRLASMYSVGRTQISKIIHYERWKHV